MKVQTSMLVAHVSRKSFPRLQVSPRMNFYYIAIIIARQGPVGQVAFAVGSLDTTMGIIRFGVTRVEPTEQFPFSHLVLYFLHPTTAKVRVLATPM